MKLVLMIEGIDDFKNISIKGIQLREEMKEINENKRNLVKKERRRLSTHSS